MHQQLGPWRRKVEPIFDVKYWSRRLREANGRGLLHEAVFRCPKEQWEAIAVKHREILLRHVLPSQTVLDVGCGWGRLCEMLPLHVHAYTGVDLSSDFIDLARRTYGHHPRRRFYVGGAEALAFSFPGERFDWAVMVSIRPMVIRNIGQKAWDHMERGVRSVANKLLYLEYDPTDEGSVE